MIQRRLKEPPPELEECVPAIKRRMHGKSGKVTLHFLNGRFETVEWGDREDSRCLVQQERG